MSSDASSTSPSDFPRFHTEILPERALLLPVIPEISACKSLQQAMQGMNLENCLVLQLVNPVTHETHNISIRCVNGGALYTDWEDTAPTSDIDTIQSNNPCNTEMPPCRRSHSGQKTSHPPTSFFHIFQRRSDPSVEGTGDTEIPKLKLLRSSLQLTHDTRIYQVIIQQHFRTDNLGEQIMFCVTLSFGRCGRGQNTLSIRCPGEDCRGLIIIP